MAAAARPAEKTADSAPIAQWVRSAATLKPAYHNRISLPVPWGASPDAGAAGSRGRNCDCGWVWMELLFVGAGDFVNRKRGRQYRLRLYRPRPDSAICWRRALEPG